MLFRSIVGASFGEVMKVADFVGYMYMAGRRRILDFNPTEKWVGKNPAGWEPFEVPPVAKSQAFMADLFDKGRAALGALSDESAQVMRQVETWRATIDSYTTAKQFTDAIPLLNAITVPMVQIPVKKILMDAAEAKGITFDRAKKVFVQPEPAAV